MMQEQVLWFVLEVNGTAFRHHFLFLIMWVKFDGLVMAFEDFFHLLLILPWVVLGQLLLISITKTRHLISNFLRTLKPVLFLWSCTLSGHTFIVEVTCRHGR